MKITEKQLTKRVEGWMEELRDLGASHWRLDSLEVIEGECTFLASVQAADYYDRFRLRFAREFLDEATEQKLDETIVHELVHVAMRDLDDTIDRVHYFVPMGSDSDWSAAVKMEREGLVQRLAVTIVGIFYANQK